jgi:uncharacterized membrane protein
MFIYIYNDNNLIDSVYVLMQQLEANCNVDTIAFVHTQTATEAKQTKPEHLDYNKFQKLNYAKYYADK